MSQLQVTGEAKIRDLQGPVVANAGVITALDGLPSQYVRGDGTLADVPSVTGGGSSVSYYLNGSVNQGTFGGSTYYQLGENAITGIGTNFSTSTNGLLAQFITDIDVPDQIEIPSGNWNIEFYMGVSASSGALASFYVEIYKYDGTTFTLIGTNVATPEFLTNTTTVDSYFTSVAMPLTAMAQTDRIAIRVYTNVAGKTVTLYTEDNRLCQVVTTFSRGILSMNSLTDQQQYLTVGTAGTDFNIVSSVDTHTFNIPVASATNTGKLSSTDWSIFNAKQPAGNYVTLDTTQTITSEKTFSNTITFADYALMNIGVALSKTSGTPLYASTNGYANLQLVNAGSVNSLYLNDGDTGKFTKLSFNNAADYTYTFPALSGTLALLEGSQTFTGDKTFDGITNFDSAVLFNALQNQFSNGLQIAKTNTILRSTGYMSISANAGTGSSIKFSDGNSTYDTLFNFDNTGNRNYTFPSASGTIALTSDLGNYVTLGTAQTITGAKIFTSNIEINKSGQAALSIVSTSGNSANIFNYVGGVLKSAISTSDTDFRLISSIDNVLKFQTNANFVGSLIFSNSANYSYTFPSASGTLALTSNLSSYLPLVGGTLTGQLYVNTGGSDNQLALVGTAPSLRLTNAISGATINGFIAMSGAANNYIQGSVSGDMCIGNQNNGKILFGFGAGTATPKVTIDSTGAATFSSSVTATQLIQSADNSTEMKIGRYNSSFPNAYIDAVGPSGDVGFQFRTQIAGAGGGTKMVITASGNVGIGTSSPQTLLHLQKAQGTGSILLRMQNDSVDGYTGVHLYGSDSTLKGHFGWANTSAGTLADKMYFGTIAAKDVVFTTNDTERMRITSGGLVGIGNSAPAAGLDIQSGSSSANISFRVRKADTITTFYVRGDGYVFAPSVYYFTTGSGANMFIDSDGAFYRSTSSLKYKTDVKDYTNGLNEVMQLRPVFYKGKTDGDKQFAGLIAEEVHDLGLTEFVQYAEDGTPDALAYQNMIALAFKAIQEQQAQIDELKKLINK